MCESLELSASEIVAIVTNALPKKEKCAPIFFPSNGKIKLNNNRSWSFH